jgi:4-hydroxy-3-methylbut-2-en-1-yl diphosphate synthase IspG/GcpE
VPTTTRTQVGGAELDQPSHLGWTVVGSVVEVRSRGAAGLVELLEEQLEWGAVIVVPLSGELRRG